MKCEISNAVAKHDWPMSKHVKNPLRLNLLREKASVIIRARIHHNSRKNKTKQNKTKTRRNIGRYIRFICVLETEKMSEWH